MQQVCFNISNKQYIQKQMIEIKIKKFLKYFNSFNYKRTFDEKIKLLKKNPKSSYLKNLLGFAYLENKDLTNAEKNFLASIQLNKNNIAAINNLGNTYGYLHRYKEAESYYKQALTLDPNYIKALNNYANLKFTLNITDEAISLYEKILSIDPQNFITYYNLALIYQSIGNFSETIKHANKVLEIEPNFTRAHKILSNYTKYEKGNEHLIKMQNQLSNNNISDDQLIYLHFALAKALNDTGNFNQSIIHLKKGNSIKADLANYKIDQDINLFKSIESAFARVDFNSLELKNNTTKLIFVVGMPRSGTSLVEQILSSHEKVYGAGELSFLGSDINRYLANNSNNLNTLLKDSSELNLIAKIFLKKSFPMNNNKILLDKSLFNFLWIGFIRVIFPKAKIIHVKRSAKDTCLSCYKTLFDSGLYFTYNEKHLATYYNYYNNLMNFWKNVLGDYFYTINYEDLIIEPNKNISNILNFLELNFDEKCINFQENKSPVKTMSASQVRQKIYSSSINSYVKYEDEIPDLFKNLTVE